MYTFLGFYFFLAAVLSIIFTLLEIQIEGSDGWAKKLPTWKFYHPLFKFIPGGNKHITGYHLYMWLFIFIYPHIVFLFTSWTLPKECIVISFVVLVLRLEDLLWFVLNPKFGILRFRREFISWHKQWWLGLPVQYYISIIVWLVLFYVGVKFY